MHHILILIISFIALLWAANHLVVGATALGYKFNLSPLLTGLTVVALSTSLPELLLSLSESLKGFHDLAISNSVGSNIANLGLVLGIIILIKPNALNYHTLKKIYPIVLIAMLFMYSLILDGYLSSGDGCLLLILCFIVIAVFIYLAHRSLPQDPIFNKLKTAMSTTDLLTSISGIMLGFIVLPLSAKYIVTSTMGLAHLLHINVLAFCLMAQVIGTTLPELSTSIIAALRGEEELAVGTILGSNIYNLILVLVFPALISPGKVNAFVLWRDIPVMILLTLFLIFLNYNYKKSLSHWHGGVLILIYFSYIVSVGLKATAA